MFCDQCRASLKDSYKFCYQCGTEQESIISIPKIEIKNQKFNIWWFFKSIGFFSLATIAIFIMLLISIMSFKVYISDDILVVLVIAGGAFGFLVGGFLTAYFSPGTTIREPALAIAIFTVISFTLLGAVKHSLLGAVKLSLLVWFIPYFIAYFGAKAGEKLQQMKVGG